jgi:hypothetical protein
VTRIIKLCTWNEDGQKCQRHALHARYDKKRRPWAYLCKEHDWELTTALNSGDSKAWLRAWACARDTG